MRRFLIMPPVRNPFFLWLFDQWNKFMMWWARRCATKQAIEQNKAMYGSQMFSSIIVYSSEEKKKINMKMAKGKQMNHAQVLRWSLFVITPEQARKKNT